ncbi:MAG: tRNA (adenine-N1)-methyltransferase [Candidatus Nanopelagicales bacterium]
MTSLPDRRAPGELRPGDIVQLTDPKGRPHTITLTPGRSFHTHKGGINHDDLLAAGEGSVVMSTNGTGYVVLRSRLEDFTLGMPRGAAVIYPKDAARIVNTTNLAAGSRVVEAGAGSGALTAHLLTAVGDQGHVRSIERRADFAEIASDNVRSWFGHLPPSWELQVGDFQDANLKSKDFDACVLDMLAPWECIEAAAWALRPGGVLVAYVATTTQLSRIGEALREHGGWTEPRAEDSMVRTWHLEGLSVRPDHRMVAHTGFLLITRRLAPGAVLPARRTRPAKGAYGEDYTPAGT